MKNILVTGPSGFLGSHLVKALVAESYRVIALKRRALDLRRLAAVQSEVVFL